MLPRLPFLSWLTLMAVVAFYGSAQSMAVRDPLEADCEGDQGFVRWRGVAGAHVRD